MDKYAVNQASINSILNWVESGTVAIPEIQRPFVWSSSQVRDLMDSLYEGYPVGYIITWQNPTVKLKDGSAALGKKILIDGQQRITALRAAVGGLTVIGKDYKEKRIIISFNPITEEFKTQTASTQRGAEWIADISEVMAIGYDTLSFIDQYIEKNPNTDRGIINSRLNQLVQIRNKQIGEIQLSSDLDINVVNEIFVRINRSGVSLSNADFVMSKIAVYEKEQGDELGMNLRKFIDYFCHLAVAPDQYKLIQANDSKFSSTEYFSKISWLKNESDDLFDPTYNDIIRVVSLTQFSRGSLGDLVALLSGRDFETREDKKEIADESFSKFEHGLYHFVNENRFKHFLQDILRSSGYDDKSMLIARNAVNYAYAIFLKLHDINENHEIINKNVRRLLAISLLTARHSGSFETRFEEDIKKIKKPGDIQEFIRVLEEQELSEVFWNSTLPDQFDKVNISNPFWHMFVAAQKKLMKSSFLCDGTKVTHLSTGDIHHIFPKNYLVKNKLDKSDYNKIANFVYLRNDINIAIKDRSPAEYIGDVIEKGYGTYHSDISNVDELKKNFNENAIPEILENASINDYSEFMRQRRILMAKLVKDYYKEL